MTSDVGRLNVVAYFPDLKRARAAIDSLQFGGFDPLSISLLGGGARDAERQMNTRTNTTPSDGGMAGRLLSRAALGGFAGACFGALIGVIVAAAGLTFMPYMDSFSVQVSAFAFYGFVAGVFLGSMSAISQGEAWQLTFADEGGIRHEILVAVHSDDSDQIDHAEKLLRGQTPAGVERFTGDAPPPAVLAHIQS